MNDEIQMIIDDSTERMEHAIAHLDHELAHIRAGKASPRMIESVMVDYYGVPTPIMQVANVNTPDARTIAIQPWEKKIIFSIRNARTTRMNANIHLRDAFHLRQGYGG